MAKVGVVLRDRLHRVVVAGTLAAGHHVLWRQRPLQHRRLPHVALVVEPRAIKRCQIAWRIFRIQVGVAGIRRRRPADAIVPREVHISLPAIYQFRLSGGTAQAEPAGLRRLAEGILPFVGACPPISSHVQIAEHNHPPPILQLQHRIAEHFPEQRAYLFQLLRADIRMLGVIGIIRTLEMRKCDGRGFSAACDLHQGDSFVRPRIIARRILETAEFIVVSIWPLDEWKLAQHEQPAVVQLVWRKL